MERFSITWLVSLAVRNLRFLRARPWIFACSSAKSRLLEYISPRAQLWGDDKAESRDTNWTSTTKPSKSTEWLASLLLWLRRWGWKNWSNVSALLYNVLQMTFKTLFHEQTRTLKHNIQKSLIPSCLPTNAISSQRSNSHHTDSGEPHAM